MRDTNDTIEKWLEREGNLVMAPQLLEALKGRKKVDMGEILKQVLLVGLDMVRSVLGNRETPAAKEMAANILGEMAEEAVRQGVTHLTPEFRAPYERRIMEAWRFLGLIDEV